jgi:hypothetical protein
VVLQDEGQLWDLTRPLIGDCMLTLLKFDSDTDGANSHAGSDSKTVFWHSSAHILGAALESVFGAHLTIGRTNTAACSIPTLRAVNLSTTFGCIVTCRSAAAGWVLLRLVHGSPHHLGGGPQEDRGQR